MAVIKMSLFTGALALAGMLAPQAVAMAPLSEHTTTETAAPQEIGSMTSEGFLVYSLNQCTIVQTTICDITMSTGAPVPSYEGPGVSSAPSDGGEDTAYPLPTITGGEDVTASPAPSGEDTSVGYGTGTQTVSAGESGETGIETATFTSTVTTDEGEASGTATATGTGDETTSATDTSETDAPSAAVPLGYNLLGAVVAVFATMILI